MSAVAVNRSVRQPILQTVQRGRTPHMTIRIEGTNTKVRLPYSPQGAQATNLGRAWQELERSGLNNLLVPGSLNRAQLQYQLFIGEKQNDRSIVPILNVLESIARTKKRVQVTYTSWESGYYQIQSMSVTVLQRSSKDNEPTRATVDVTFTSAQQRKLNIGPVSGGVKTPTGGSGAQQDFTYRTYSVKAGDTLQSIATALLGDSSMWMVIAKINKILNPRDLKVGKKLLIPPRGTE